MLQLTELEALLESDQGPAHRAALEEALRSALQSTKRDLMRGLAPKEYEMCQAKQVAIEAAIDVLTSK